jgi:two-component system sensor histidine kinase/response regulator
MAKKHSPDLIICDVLMPELSGYGVLTELRSNSLTSTIPFIFLTARASQQDIRHGMKLGADDYLTKPFKVSDLLEAIHARLEKHALESKQFDDLRLHLSSALPHELKTPLVAIIGFTEFLLNIDRNLLPDIDEILEMQRTIYECAHRLEHLIENYLLYANLRLSEYDREKQALWQQGRVSFDPAPLITTVATQRAGISQRENDLTIGLNEGIIRCLESHLGKIVDEVVDNACKFSEPGTPISIISTIVNDEYILSVRDQGHGMSAEQIAAIDAFIQFERREYEQQGLGLGLTISRMLAQLYDGELKVESTPNQGTTVTVTFNIVEPEEIPAFLLSEEV